MKKYLVLTLCLFIACLIGCKGNTNTDKEDNKNDNENENEEPICGGVTNKTNYDAPKVINSDKLVSFSVGFYHEDKYDKSEGRYYTFVLEPDTSGKIILKDSYVGEGFEVPESVFDGVSKIIKKYDLAKANGVNKITAGLPPEYEECDFTAVYDSGESISFAENSDPSSDWGRELIDYFAVIFAEHGDDQYLTPMISGVITCFNLEIQKDNILYIYSTDGENQIYKSIYDVEKEEMLDEVCVDSNQEYYDGILEIVRDMEIRDFENYESSSDFDPGAYYDFFIEYDSGDRMSGASCDPETIDRFMPLGTELMNYIDKYIDSKRE